MLPRLLRALAASAMLLACLPHAAVAQDEAGVAHDAEGNAIIARAADPERMRAVMLTAARQVIEPGYARFHAAGEALAAAMDALCAGPDEGRLDAARAAFTDTALAWGRVENVRIGPVMSQDRLERVLFWPDRKSIGLKQVQALLASEDKSALTLDSLQGKSVAVQGLGAIEFVLFGTGSKDLAAAPGYRCGYGLAVARNLAAIGGELETAWDRPEEVLAAWMRDDDPTRATEMLNELVGALVHGLEATRDIRLRGFMGETAADDRPRRAIFWRSANTVPMIAADIEGLQALFTDSTMDTLLPDDMRSVGDSVRFEFHQLLDVAGGVGQPIASVVKDPDSRGKLVLLDIVMDSLIDRLDTQFAPAAGLASGFSFSDGD